MAFKNATYNKVLIFCTYGPQEGIKIQMWTFMENRKYSIQGQQQ